MKNGFATVEREFDSQGNQTKVAFFDAAGAPTASDEGIAHLSASIIRGAT